MPHRLRERAALTVIVFAMVFAGACNEYGLAPLAGYLGKEFYAVDLNNFDGASAEGGATADGAQFAVTVSNPAFSDGRASVRITQIGGDGEGVTGTVEPGSLEVFALHESSVMTSGSPNRRSGVKPWPRVDARRRSGTAAHDRRIVSLPLPQEGPAPQLWPQRLCHRV